MAHRTSPRLSAAARGMAVALAVAAAGVATPVVEPAGPAVVGAVTLQASLPSRLSAGNAIQIGITVSRERFGDRGARHAVLTRNDNWPDALASAPLTAEGPILFTPPSSLNADTLAEIRRVLPTGATIYLVGGESAISSSIALQLTQSGFRPRRLSGPDRVSTSVAIAEEVVRLYDTGDELVVARSRGPAGNETAGWADSVSGSAYAARKRLPVVVTDTNGVDAAVTTYISRYRPTTTWILGGTSAVSSSVESNVPNPRRVFGNSRSGTAAAIATRMWSYPSSAGYLLVNGRRNDGWAFGLSAAGFGADNQTPILLVDDGLPEPTGQILGTCAGGQTPFTAVGSTTQVSAAVVQLARDAAAGACSRTHTSFSYMAVNDDGSPARYNPCATLEFVVNPDGGPVNGLTLLRSALDKMSAATGMSYTLGVTDERMDTQTSQRNYVGEGAYKPILVNWPRSWGSDRAYGYGGSAAIRNANGKRQYVSGIINLNPATPATDGTLDHVMTHEVAHVIGLSHIEDDAQLMFPYAQPDVVEYQPGDRAGLSTLGIQAGCMGATASHARAGEQPEQFWGED